MITALGGPADFCDKPWSYLPKAAIIRPVFPTASGYVAGMDTRGIGLSIIEMKGGRTTPEQKLDYATGYSDFCQIGDYVDNQTPLAVIHAQTEEQYQRAAKHLQSLITITDKTPAPTRCIIKKIS